MIGIPKYSLKDDYFNKINNHKKAYILGFIYADGSMSRHGNLRLVIHKRDLSVLEFIKRELEYSGPILDFNKKKYNDTYKELIITRKNLATDLLNLGIIPNKTYESTKLPTVDKEFIGSFLLGLFDGDGYVSNQIKDNIISFSNSRVILEEVKTIFNMELNVNGHLRSRRNNENSWMLEYKGSLQIEKIYNFMYKNSEFYLTRKHKRFKQILLSAEKYKNTNYELNGNKLAIIKLYQDGRTQKEISEKMNLPPSSVRGVIQRARKNKIVNRVDSKSKQKVKVNDIIFESITECAKFYNTKPSNIFYRVKSSNYPDYIRMD